MKAHLVILISLIIVASSSKAQDTSVYTQGPTPHLNFPPKEVVLLEKETGTKFILDSAEVYIKAIDTSGKILWVTDPYIDSHLNEWKHLLIFEERPRIVQFYLRKDKFTNNKVEIFINYNIGFGLYGWIDLKDGKFNFLGAD